MFAVSTADKFLTTGAARRALVIGAETFSRIVDWEDRTTCVLFGDGAGAVVLEARSDAGEPRRPQRAACARTGGTGTSSTSMAGRARPGTTGHLRMEGREVFRFAVGQVTDVIADAFAQAGVTAADLDWFVPHQANRRIIEASADKLGIAREKIVLTVDRHGNTSAASIPLALDVARRDGRIQPRRPRDDRGDRRRLQLGRGADPLVTHGLRWPRRPEAHNPRMAPGPRLTGRRTPISVPDHRDTPSAHGAAQFAAPVRRRRTCRRGDTAWQARR